MRVECEGFDETMCVFEEMGGGEKVKMLCACRVGRGRKGRIRLRVCLRRWVWGGSACRVGRGGA